MELKQNEIKDRKGKYFSKETLYYILRNVIYTGKILYGENLYQEIHESIISEDLFNLAQQIHKGK